LEIEAGGATGCFTRVTGGSVGRGSIGRERIGGGFERPIRNGHVERHLERGVVGSICDGIRVVDVQGDVRGERVGGDRVDGGVVREQVGKGVGGDFRRAIGTCFVGEVAGRVEVAAYHTPYVGTGNRGGDEERQPKAQAKGHGAAMVPHPPRR
jgi:hypothetical protein